MHVAVRRIFRRQLSTDSANALKEMIAEMQAGTPKILPTNVEFAEISSAFDVLREKVNVADELIPVDGILSVVGVQDSAVARQAVTIFSMEKSNGNRVLDLNRFARMVWSYCPAMTEKYFYSFALPFGVEEEARVQDNNELKHIHKDYETVMYVLTAWFVGGKKKSKHEIVPSLGTPEMDNFMSDEFHAFGHDFVMRLNRLFFPAFQFQSKLQGAFCGPGFWAAAGRRLRRGRRARGAYLKWRLRHTMEHHVRYDPRTDRLRPDVPRVPEEGPPGAAGGAGAALRAGARRLSALGGGLGVDPRRRQSQEAVPKKPGLAKRLLRAKLGGGGGGGQKKRKGGGGKGRRASSPPLSARSRREVAKQRALRGGRQQSASLPDDFAPGGRSSGGGGGGQGSGGTAGGGAPAGSGSGEDGSNALAALRKTLGRADSLTEMEAAADTALVAGLADAALLGDAGAAARLVAEQESLEDFDVAGAPAGDEGWASSGGARASFLGGGGGGRGSRLSSGAPSSSAGDRGRGRPSPSHASSASASGSRRGSSSGATTAPPRPAQHARPLPVGAHRALSRGTPSHANGEQSFFGQGHHHGGSVDSLHYQDMSRGASRSHSRVYDHHDGQVDPLHQNISRAASRSQSRASSRASDRSVPRGFGAAAAGGASGAGGGAAASRRSESRGYSSGRPGSRAVSRHAEYRDHPVLSTQVTVGSAHKHHHRHSGAEDDEFILGRRSGDHRSVSLSPTAANRHHHHRHHHHHNHHRLQEDGAGLANSHSAPGKLPPNPKPPRSSHASCQGKQPATGFTEEVMATNHHGDVLGGDTAELVGGPSERHSVNLKGTL